MSSYTIFRLTATLCLALTFALPVGVTIYANTVPVTVPVREVQEVR